jgi:hypothetical protein
MTDQAWRTAALLVALLATACGAGVDKTCAPSTEVCNGVDDDCDGRVDEELGVTTCGLGTCLRSVPACDGGVPGQCVPGTPGTEACNGIDDDCDGTVDNGCACVVGQAQPCYSGPPGTLDVGSCHAGSQTCVAGQWGACDGEQLPAAETCNGADDDCDGQVDDGLGTTSCGVGACARTVQSCEGGAATTCSPGAPSAEACNGIDDDCDGTVDDGNPGGGASCSTAKLGVCAAGTTACTGGAIVCQQNVQPTSEACNNRDDNCDGSIDEGNPGGGLACNTGMLGACAPGTTFCSNGGLVCQQNVQPSAEVCNGLDDNCNGMVDDGNPGGGLACSTGKLGVCAPGTTLCAGGAITCQQNVQPSAEICANGLDDDCDGIVDNC